MKTSLAFALVAAASLVAVAVPEDTAHAAPPGLPATPIDLDVRQIEVGTVFRLLAKVSKRDVVLDPCVTGKVDLKLRNAPIPIVYDALAMKLRLRYGERDGAIVVGCLGPDEPALGPDPRLDRRVTVHEQAAPARAALADVAKAAGLGGVDLRAGADHPVTIVLENARLGTVLAAVGDETGLRVSLEGDRLVAEQR